MPQGDPPSPAPPPSLTMNFGANDPKARPNSKLIRSPRCSLDVNFSINETDRSHRSGRRSCSPMRPGTLMNNATTEPRRAAFTRSHSYDYGFSPSHGQPKTITCTVVPDKPAVVLEDYMNKKKNPPPPKREQEKRPDGAPKRTYEPPAIQHLAHMERRALGQVVSRNNTYNPPPYGVGPGQSPSRLATGKKYVPPATGCEPFKITDRVPTAEERARDRSRSPNRGKSSQMTPKDTMRHPWVPPRQTARVSARSRSCPPAEGVSHEHPRSQKPTYPHKTSSQIRSTGGVLSGQSDPSVRGLSRHEARHAQTYSVQRQQLPPGKSTLRGRSCDVGRSLSVGREGPAKDQHLPTYTHRKRLAASDFHTSGGQTQASLAWTGPPQATFSRRPRPHTDSTFVRNALSGRSNPLPRSGKRPMSHAITFCSRQITVPQTLPSEPSPGAKGRAGGLGAAADPWRHTRLWG